MDLVVNETLKAYIDPLTPDEHAALERSLLAEGCRDALVLWGDVLVDGHNRYGICRQHGLPFRTVQNTRFQSLQDVQLWMIDQHLGRRSLSDYQRGVLALRQREIVAERRTRDAATPASSVRGPADEGADPRSGDGLVVLAPAPLDTREALARAAGLRSAQVQMIEKIQRQAAPELVAAVRAGLVSLHAAAELASLPADEQVAAAVAGKDELKQAAKRAREARRKPSAGSDGRQAGGAEEPAPVGGAAGADAPSLEALRQRIAQLNAENDGLRRQVASLEARLAATAGPAAGLPPF